MKITLFAANARFTHSAPALFAVRNALEAKVPGAAIRLRQGTINDPYHESLLTLAADRPDAFFVSAYIWSGVLLRRLLVDLRRLFPTTPLVVGGPQAPWLDLPPEVAATVVHGPVEGLPPTFYADLLAGRLGAEYHADRHAPFAMPYREEDFRHELRHRQIYYESSRGCPFACAYCLSAAKRGVQQRELPEVLAELGQILAHRPASLRFVDRTFNADPARSLVIWRFLAGQETETACHFEIAPDLFSREMLDFLGTVPPGRFQFEVGLQSTHAPTLAAINRKVDLSRAFANIRALRALDTIHLHLDLILGLPEETAASFRQSFNEAFALAPHYLQMGLLKVLPGTPLVEKAAEYGLVAEAEAPYSLLANRWLDQASLAELYWLGESVEAFCNNRYFLAFFRYLRQVEDDPFVFFTGLRDLGQARGLFDRAKTQEFLSGLLAELAASRPDRELLLELLRYDWLACGHRFVPAHLEPALLKESRDRLWHSLPADLPPLYTPQGRNEFFKRALFAPFSGELLAAVGFANPPARGVVCFLPEQESGVLPRQRTVLLPEAEA
ncbi:MAG: DUF4080 domain-containing protein [Thermodesulfobacteriota bacterium]